MPPRATLGRAGVLLSLAAALPAAAATPEPDVVYLPDLVVTATLLPTPTSEVGSSITVITAADIEQNQWRTLPDALQTVPGVTIVQNGGPGGLSSAYLRGTNANHVKVLLDGIDVSDPSSTDDSVDLSQILTTDIERIEVLRGPQSGLYGSDAIGGVINIITRKGDGPATVTARLEGGSSPLSTRRWASAARPNASITPPRSITSAAATRR